MQCRKTTFDHTFSSESNIHRIYSMDEGRSLTIVMRENCAGRYHFGRLAAPLIKKCGEYNYIQNTHPIHDSLHESKEDFHISHHHLIRENGLPITIENFRCLMQEIGGLVVDNAARKEYFLKDPEAQDTWGKVFYSFEKDSFSRAKCDMAPDSLAIMPQKDVSESIMGYSTLSLNSMCLPPNYLKIDDPHEETTSTSQTSVLPIAGTALLLGMVGIFCCCSKDDELEPRNTKAVQKKIQ